MATYLCRREEPMAIRGGGSVGNFTGTMGIPTLGVMGALAHAFEEHTMVEGLAYRRKLFAGLLLSV